MNTFLAQKYFEYKLKAKNEHSIHSPFVFELYCCAIKDDDNYYILDKLKKTRSQLEAMQSFLTVEDFGAGSKHFITEKRKISEIAKHGTTSEKYSRLLFRLTEYFNAEYIVELGTSVGLNALYLAAASSKSKVLTLEGSSELCKFAKKLCIAENRKNIQVIEGDFNLTFSNILKTIPKLDFLFIDGNHRKEPTLNYFEEALQKNHNDSVFVFDDIYWSKEMFEAWQEIKSHSKVTLSIDLFQFGIVFFRREHLTKEHFILKV